MKAYLILSILLATILFFPSSIPARELAAGQGTKSRIIGTTDPNREICVSKNGSKYYCDITPNPVPKPCDKYSKKCHPSGP